jgi:hypothetical protein
MVCCSGMKQQQRKEKWSKQLSAVNWSATAEERKNEDDVASCQLSDGLLPQQEATAEKKKWNIHPGWGGGGLLLTKSFIAYSSCKDCIMYTYIQTRMQLISPSKRLAHGYLFYSFIYFFIMTFKNFLYIDSCVQRSGCHMFNLHKRQTLVKVVFYFNPTLVWNRFFVIWRLWWKKL